MRRHKEDRLQKDLLYSALTVGNRPIGLPKLRFKDVLKFEAQDDKLQYLTRQVAVSCLELFFGKMSM